MASESTGTNSIPGVDGAGQAGGVKSDAMSNVGGNSAANTYGPGSSGASSSISPSPSEADRKKEKSKSYWMGFKKK